jgi:hypothetical protein
MTLEERVRRVTNWALMLWKRTLSYRKNEWEFRDYPIRLRIQKDVPDSSRFWGRILGWNLDGLGETREDALRELEETFNGRKTVLVESGKPIPRPGTDVPITFASQDRVNAHRALLDDFVDRVLGFQWAFVSDESSLSDFHGGDDNGQLVARIKEVYGVDVSDVGNVAEILERIAAAQSRC